jgi:hypothetical protein
VEKSTRTNVLAARSKKIRVSLVGIGAMDEEIIDIPLSQLTDWLTSRKYVYCLTAAPFVAVNYGRKCLELLQHTGWCRSSGKSGCWPCERRSTPL